MPPQAAGRGAPISDPAEGRSIEAEGRKSEAEGRESLDGAGGGVRRHRRRRRRGGVLQFKIRPKAGVLRPKADKVGQVGQVSGVRVPPIRWDRDIFSKQQGWDRRVLSNRLG